MKKKVHKSPGTKVLKVKYPPDLWQPGKSTPRFPFIRQNTGDTSGLSKAKIKSPTKRDKQSTRKAF